MAGKKQRGRGLETQAIATEAYQATAAVGKVSTVLTTVFIDLFLLLFLGIGIYLVQHKEVYTASTEGTITEKNCAVDTNKQMQCAGTVEYEVDGKKYKQPFANQGQVHLNQKRTLRYNPDDPSDFTMSPKTKWVGWILVIVMPILLLLSWVWVWFVFKYKIAAAAAGVGTIANMAIPDGN